MMNVLKAKDMPTLNKKMAKILIFFDHDVTIRHFLKSGSLSEIYKKHDVETTFYDLKKKKINSF